MIPSALLPHPFEPSGRVVGRSRVEACGLCNLAQRGAGSMHPDHVCCMCPDQTPPLPCCNAGHSAHSDHSGSGPRSGD